MIETGVCQDCVLAPDSFATGMDWLLERTVGTGTNGVSFGLYSFSDVDCRWCRSNCQASWTPRTCTWDDDIKGCISRAWGELAEDKVQALDSRKDEPSTIIVLGQEVAVLKNSSILAALSTQPLKAVLVSHVAIPSLVWLSRTQTIRFGSQESLSLPSWSCIIIKLAFYLFSCMALTAGQLSREMHTRLILSINGVCKSCHESNV